MKLNLKDITDKYNCTLNPDEEARQETIDRIESLAEKYGKLYCACTVVGKNGIPATAKVCPCSDLEDQLIKQGHCHCRLFYRETSFNDKDEDGLFITPYYVRCDWQEDLKRF